MGTPNFADKTIWTGDNLDILRGMNSKCVDLIYLDPPFNSNRDYAAPIGSAAAGAAGAAFKDTWKLSDLTIAWIWTYGGSGRGAKAIATKFPRNHDVILVYGKGKNAIHNRVRVPVKHYISNLPSHICIGEDGRAFKTAPGGDYTDESVARLESEGRIHRTTSGNIRIKYDLPSEDNYVIEERMAGDLWGDIPDIAPPIHLETEHHRSTRAESRHLRVVATTGSEGVKRAVRWREGGMRCKAKAELASRRNDHEHTVAGGV